MMGIAVPQITEKAAMSKVVVAIMSDLVSLIRIPSDTLVDLARIGSVAWSDGGTLIQCNTTPTTSISDFHTANEVDPRTLHIIDFVDTIQTLHIMSISIPPTTNIYVSVGT